MLDHFVRVHQSFDRVTAFDFIEHLERADAEKLIGLAEQIAQREVVFFVPIETDDPRCTEFMAATMETVPACHRDLQTHRSRWTPEWFTSRGYLTLLLPDFHCPGFSAFFAAKYRRPDDRALIEARLRAWFEEAKPTYRIDRPIGVAHPECMTLGDGVSIGYGSRLECVCEHGGQTYQPRLTIGDGTTAEFHLHIGCAERITIGRDCLIAGHVTIMDHSHLMLSDRPLHGQPLTVAQVVIGDSVFVGEYAYIGPGVHIGDHAVIGAHSVVVKDVPAYAVVAGVPAKLIRQEYDPR
jgi:carbonic anhydrase/acetyltransferase-like protein (isoleucine patch superfamily)